MLLSIIGCLFYVFLRFLYTKNTELYICILIWINFDFFYLVPQIGQYDNYPLLILPTLILIIAEFLIRGKLKFGKSSGILVSCFCALLILGVLTAYTNGQSLVLGLKAIKFSLLILIFFTVTSQHVNIEKLGDYIIFMSLILVAFLFIDLFVIQKNMLFVDSEKYLNTRGGGLRFSVGYYVIAIACIFSFIKFLKKMSFIHLSIFLVIACYIFFVIQTRMLIFGVFLSCFSIVVILNKISPGLIISILFLSLLAASSILLVGNYFTKVGIVEQTITDVEKKRGNYQARVLGYSYYLNKISKSPIWGYGYENINWDKSIEIQLQENGIYKSDIGITHFFYENGVLGMFWFFAMVLIVLKKTWLFKDKYPEVIVYFILSFSVMVTLDFLFDDSTILLFGIFLGILARLEIQEHENTVGV